MKWKDFIEKANTGTAFTDGSMGVFLQRYGLKGEDCPELWNVTNAEIVQGVHRSYVEAGCDLVITNSLGGNRIKLADYHLENRLKELNTAAVKNARIAAGNKAIVAGDVGPTGLFISPLGSTTFDDMVSIYEEQIKVLADAGCDAIFLETHIDILEMKAAIIASRNVCDLPVIASATFEKDGRMVTGTPPDAAFATLEALGADMIGSNCGTGPEDMARIFKSVEGLFTTPMVAQANAGLPKVVDGKTVFDTTPEMFSQTSMRMIESGVCAIGGCCGTTPEHIKLLADENRKQKPFLKRIKSDGSTLILSSRFGVRKVGLNEPFTVIGERLNPTARKALAGDITTGQYQLFKEEAINQEKAGAHILDMNMGIPGVNEAEIVVKGLEILTSSVNIPIAIDSSNPEAVRAGLRVYPGKPLLNSITAEADRLALLPDVKKYGAAFIALPIDERGIPKTAEERVKLMRKIIAEAAKHGISKKNIIADPLVLTVSAEPDAARETLKTVRLFREELGLCTTMGLSNVSYGLPARGYVNRTFMSMSMANGLTSAIANPFDNELMGAVRAADVLLEKDSRAKNYVEQYASAPKETFSPIENSKKSDSGTEAQPLEKQLFNAVLRGSKDSIGKLVQESLKQGHKAFQILNEFLIPGITEAGNLYEKKVYFLPQLMLAAETMQTAFVILEPLLKEQSAKPKAKIVFATVKGDVHDIGKNIVILMLKNHGFEVTDLGKDVPNETILSEAIRLNADMIGLSALMTTTMPRMQEFTELMKSKNKNFPVIIGGAAVTRAFADSIGAVYSNDAVEAVRIANQISTK